MPGRLVDSQGRPIRLADNPKSGGEGRVHGVIGSPDLVAKVYHSSSMAEPEKLRLLIAAKNEALLRFAAWPTGTLHEKKATGPVVGFLMPKISGYEEIHELYSPQKRLQLFPDADWRMLAIVAENLAVAFHTIHERGFLVGDVNEKNTLVAADGSIRLIDCDSFQARTADGRILRCGVGTPEFTPPELQGRNFREVNRNEDHDRFGLAVMIFLLLFANRHPFGSAANRESRFIYARDVNGRSDVPPGALSLDAIPFSLAQLFERAFAPPGSRGARPSAAEWLPALSEFRDRLRQCSLIRTHYYHPVASRCPWCRLEAKYPVRLFRHARFSVIAPRDVWRIPLPSWHAVLLAILGLGLSVGTLTIGHWSSVPARPLSAQEIPPDPTKRVLLDLDAAFDRNYAPDVYRVLAVLKGMGPAAAPAMPKLMAILLHNDHSFRSDILFEIQTRALEAIRGIDPNWGSSAEREQLVARLLEQLEVSKRHSTNDTRHVGDPDIERVARVLELLGSTPPIHQSSGR